MDPSKPEPYSAAPDTSGNGNRQQSGEGKGLAVANFIETAEPNDLLREGGNDDRSYTGGGRP